MCKPGDKYKIVLFLMLSIFLITACSVRSVQIKRAEQHYKKGQSLAYKGEMDRAVVNFEKSMRMAKAAGFKEGIANNLNELSIIYTARGEYAKARKAINEALDIYIELNMSPEISKSLNNMAMTYVRDKNFQEAFKWFDKLMEWDKKTGNKLGIGITLYNKALIYHQHLGMEEKAREYYIKALEIFQETGNNQYIQKIQKILKKEQ